MNRTIFERDNLDVLRGLNSEFVDLIYLDPPFNSNKTYSAPIGSEAAGAAFKDTWTLDDVDDAWHGEIAEREPRVYAAIDAAGIVRGKGMKSYLIMMAVRLLEMRRVLKNTGSLYLHCDHTANHYLKTLLDAVFGHNHFRNDIIWHYTGGGRSKTRFSRKHDTILCYSRGGNATFNIDAIRVPYKKTSGFARGGITAKSGKHYMPHPLGTPSDSVWDIPMINPLSKERTCYPTQKPLPLLTRIIQASSNKGDIVLDPFCGCATTLIASEKLGRQWIGIDLSPKAAELIKVRAQRELGMGPLSLQVVRRTDIPKRTDIGKLPKYDTHKHMLYGKQEGHCGGCKYHFPFRNFTIDHVVPQTKGGIDHYENLQLLCGACNSVKGTRTQAYLIAALKTQQSG